MKKILIVEDSVLMQKAIRDILSTQYETFCAASGAEAIELYARETPDLILSELMMPQMTGLELQRALTERHGGQVIPFMFMADDKHEDSESLGLESGAMDYIGKPFKPEVLLRRVGNIMRQLDSLRQLQGLKVVAESDPLTGLLNKTTVQKTLGELCLKSSGVLMMIDLDNFKLVNDLHGHGMGDRVLVRFADILRSLVRASDVVGRVGGDEFAVFCHDIRSERIVTEKSEAINASLLASAKEFMGEEMNIPLGASIGAVFVPDEGTDFAELYRKADKALYAVKQNGKHGCNVYHGHEAHSGLENAQEPSDMLLEASRILKERNRQKGAFELGFENFRTLYRFFVRVMENYRYDAEFVVFSFAPGISDETAVAFGDLIRKTLRRSDVYTRSASNRYLVLLPHPIPDRGEIVIQRILELWSQHESYQPVTFEHGPVPLGD